MHRQHINIYRGTSEARQPRTYCRTSHFVKGLVLLSRTTSTRITCTRRTSYNQSNEVLRPPINMKNLHLPRTTQDLFQDLSHNKVRQHKTSPNEARFLNMFKNLTRTDFSPRSTKDYLGPLQCRNVLGLVPRPPQISGPTWSYPVVSYLISQWDWGLTQSRRVSKDD